MASYGGGGGDGSVASDPDFASICSFLQVFSSSYGLEPPSISSLQSMLEDTVEVAQSLRDLQVKLLRRVHKSVKPDRWERDLIKFCHQQGLHKEAWELERFSYKKASAKVKVTALKVLLEYQFTCHPKFKAQVNSLKSSELRLEPVGRDRSGRVYWLQTDQEANLRLYREDQDEETWALIARDREGLVKVINQLKSGEDTNTLEESLLNEDSNSIEISPKKNKAQENAEDSNEEFLSPESESENDNDNDKSTSVNDDKKTPQKKGAEKIENNEEISNNKNSIVEETPIKSEDKEIQENIETKCENREKTENITNLGDSEKSDVKSENVTTKSDPESTITKEESNSQEQNEQEDTKTTVEASSDSSKEKLDDKESKLENSIGEAIEEPVMLITGQGNGADCDCGDLSIWEEISEPVMYIWGYGSGYDCDTGNTGEISTESNCDEKLAGSKSESQNDKIEKLNDTKLEATNNGVDSEASDISDSVKVDKLKNENSYQAVNKRLLRENCQGGDGAVLESTPKKPCIWNVESIVKKIDSKDDNGNNDELCSKSDENGCNYSVDQSKGTQSENNESKEDLNRNSKSEARKKVSDAKSKKSVPEVSHTEPESDKNNVVEKRKSSLSSEDDNQNKVSESEGTSSQKNKKPARIHKAKPRSKSNAQVPGKPEVESLPSKKLRLDSSTDDCGKESEQSTPAQEQNLKSKKKTRSATKESKVSKEKSEECKEEESGNNNVQETEVEVKKSRVEKCKDLKQKESKKSVKDVKEEKDDSKSADKSVKEKASETPQREIRKVVRGKVRRLIKRPLPEPAESDSDKNLEEVSAKKKEETSNKQEKAEKRKRTRNTVESVSEEEVEDSVIGKRLKMKPKKVLLSSRKKIEEKFNKLKESSEESEEAPITPKKGRGKRTSSPKKTPKEKIEKKDKQKESVGKKKREHVEIPPDDDDITPVRQSRRIAQLKIREEAERRQLEEVTLRELKKKHKNETKKTKEEDSEEWKASDGEANCESTKERKKKKWRQSDSSAPQSSDSESDEPLFEREEEPDLEFKSDHEFSPESDLEDDESSEPLKRARTMKEEEGVCTVCGRGEQPEWILLCDDCDAGYHASCLKPILFLIPDGDWFCPPCQHARLIKSLERELIQFDELVIVARREMKKRETLALAAKEAEEAEKKNKKSEEEEDKEESSSDWSSSDEGTVYRLRERRQLPVSLRAQEYDRLMSSAIKEEYKEPSSSAGNQGRGKDISTIIEAAEEEKMKAEAEEGAEATPTETVKRKKTQKSRRKPRKLNSLEVPSEDDDEVDEDFKETGWDTSSETISSDAEGDAPDSDSRSSDSLPIRRSNRDTIKSRKKIVESPELKKKKGVFAETTSDSSGTKEWAKSKKALKKKRDRSRPKKSKKSRGLKQYDAEGNVIKSRVRYGGLSGSEGSNDWSPKHRTRQKKINYTEMPNTESEDEMHKPSGKHMPDSSDEFKLSNTSASSDSDAERPNKSTELDTTVDEKKVNQLNDLVNKTAVVPLQKLPDDMTKMTSEAMEAQLNAKVEAVVGTAVPPKPARGKGSRGGRGSR